jgi:hypothetical protein
MSEKKPSVTQAAIELARAERERIAAANEELCQQLRKSHAKVDAVIERLKAHVPGPLRLVKAQR